MTSLWTHTKSHPAGYREAKPQQLAIYTVKRIVDVRELDEYVGLLGHIPAAELAPLGTLETASKAWKPEEPLVMVCRSGNRSGRACSWLLSQGFTRVINLKGGMEKYTECGLPISREMRIQK